MGLNTYTNLTPVESFYNAGSDSKMRGSITVGDTGTGDITITVSPAPKYSTGRIVIFLPTDTTKIESVKYTANTAGVLTIPAAQRGLDDTIKLSTITTSYKVYFPSETDAMRFEIDSFLSSIVAMFTGYVKNTTNEVIAGIKTFTSFPITPSSTPSTDYQVANKKYVDGVVTGGIGNASTTTAGTVKIDSAEVDPIVVLKSTYDANQGERILESQIFN